MVDICLVLNVLKLNLQKDETYKIMSCNIYCIYVNKSKKSQWKLYEKDFY